MKRIHKVYLEVGSDGMICIPSFIKIGSEIQKLMGGYTDKVEIA
jgi:hypothetical protein